VKLLEVIDDPGHNKLYLLTDFFAAGSINSKSYWKKKDPAKFDASGNFKIIARIDDENTLRQYFR
jgi:hypothetical protein